MSDRADDLDDDRADDLDDDRADDLDEDAQGRIECPHCGNRFERGSNALACAQSHAVGGSA